MSAATFFKPEVIEAVAKEIWFCVVGMLEPEKRWELCAPDITFRFRMVAMAALAKAETAKADRSVA
jgi:hypothetical protein